TGAQSLSIVAPLDVLRQRLMNELNRRRMRELQGSRIQQNRQLLTSI
uniref:Diuretic hormone n=2 Tax=Gryllinae TaxID=114953 RepID=DIUH_ACHDO|nr:RecName: Full=Diuretic hormone; Short=DH; AltName: Full=Diuretic peptide; Short=DP [Acheta domesticus]AAB20249.1 Acheta-DP=diuretic peptide [Acheta domesticus=house crickets, Peptide, 46 aa] [Acheta domesticus]